MRVTSLSTNVEPPSVESGASVNEPLWFKGTGFDSEPSVPLRIPPNKANRNLGTESDAEFEEIGAFIYNQVMQRRQAKQND